MTTALATDRKQDLNYKFGDKPTVTEKDKVLFDDTVVSIKSSFRYENRRFADPSQIEGLEETPHDTHFLVATFEDGSPQQILLYPSKHLVSMKWGTTWESDESNPLPFNTGFRGEAVTQLFNKLKEQSDKSRKPTIANPDLSGATLPQIPQEALVTT